MAIRKKSGGLLPCVLCFYKRKGITVVQDEHILKLRACSKENL